MNKISVIIPIHNSEEFLNDSINSVLNQSYESLEIILINDGSNQDCEDVIKDFVQKDSRIKYYHFNTRRDPGFAKTME